LLFIGFDFWAQPHHIFLPCLLRKFVFPQLETTISSLQSHLETKNKEVAELKAKYNLQTEQGR